MLFRSEREKIESEWKAKETEFKNEQALLEQQMLAVCNESNATSIKTEQGTVIKSLKERFTVADGDSFRKFVMEQEMPELFEARIHQGNFKDFMSEHAGEGLPPGVNVMREFTITVRKPTSKV